MKKLITHINPHLDDIAAIWLFLKYNPDFKDVQYEFMPQDQIDRSGEETEDLIYLGVGRGKFDEHKGDTEDCATSLVWRYFKENNLAPKDQSQLNALEELVEFVRIVDLGRLGQMDNSEFFLPAMVRVYGSEENYDSKGSTKFGLEALDRAYNQILNKHKALIDWEKRVEVDTKWGRGAAVESEFVNRAFCNGQRDFKVFLMHEPTLKYVQYFTPVDDADLEPIYKKVKELDPDAGWFLHQSHHMVIAGSGSSPDAPKTKLSFDQLVEVLKSC